MPRIKKPNTKLFRCNECGNYCKVEMRSCDSNPTNCLYSDANITPIWEEICQE